MVSSGGGILPGSANSYSATYGGKPNVPNPGATASAAIGENIGNLGSLYQLGAGASNFAENQLISNYNAAIPDYSALALQSSKNIGSELQGALPDDVVSTIINRAAERGIMTGTSGSPNENAALVRALGLTSLDLTGRGESELSGAVARSPIAQPFDISRMFVTPEQQQEAAMAANIYAAAPNPAAAAIHLEGAASGGSDGSTPWWMSSAEQRARSSPGGAHYDPVFGTWMGY